MVPVQNALAVAAAADDNRVLFGWDMPSTWNQHHINYYDKTNANRWQNLKKYISTSEMKTVN